MAFFINPHTPYFVTAAVADALGNADIVMPSVMGSIMLRNFGDDPVFFNFDNGYPVVSGDTDNQLSDLQLNSRIPRNITYYLKITTVGTVHTISVYSDAGFTSLLCQGSLNGTAGDVILAEKNASGVSGAVGLNYVADTSGITFVLITALQQTGQYKCQRNEAVNIDDIRYSRLNLLCATGQSATVDVIAVPRTGVGQN